MEVVELEEDLKEIEIMRKELSTFFCEDSATFKLEECFRVLQSFCDRMRKAIEVSNIVREAETDRVKGEKTSGQREGEWRGIQMDKER